MKKRKNNKYIKVLFYTLIIVTLVSVLTYVALNHEFWRDESQAWIIAKNLSFADIINQMKSEGHVFIWHFILRIAYLCGLKYEYLSIISVIIMTVTAMIILKKAPFNIIFKLIIICSMPFLYDYSILARPYCLIALGTVLIGTNYKKRHENKVRYLLSILVLLSSHVIMFATVGVLFSMFYLEEIFKIKNKTKKRNVFIIVSILLFLGVIALYCTPIFLGLKDMSLVKEYAGRSGFFLITRGVVDITFFEISENLKIIVCYILFIDFIIFLIYLLFRNYKCFLILVISLTYQSLIYHYVYCILLSRIEVVIFLLLLVIYIIKSKPKDSKYYKLIDNTFLFLIGLLLMTNTFTNYQKIFDDIKYEISAGKQTADFIKRRIDEDSIFIAQDPAQATVVIGYLENYNYLFYSIDRKKYFTFEVWDHPYNTYNSDDIIKILNENFNKNQNIYLIFNCYDCNYDDMINDRYLNYTYESQSYLSEYYKIYKVNKKVFE